MKKEINKKEIVAKLRAKLQDKGVAKEELALLNRKFDTLVGALSERLSTQFVTKVDHNVIVDNLADVIMGLRENGMPVTNLKDFPAELFIKNMPEVFNVGKMEKPEWYKAPSDEVSIKGPVEVKQDATGMMSFITSIAGEFISFLGKLARNTFTVTHAEEDYLKPQTVVLYNPFTKRVIDPDKLFNIDIRNIGGGGGGMIFHNDAPTATSVTSGKKTVTTAGTEVQLGTASVKGVTIRALAANTGLIFVGDATVASTNGFQLSAGETVSLDVATLSGIYLDCSVNGEGVTWITIN